MTARTLSPEAPTGPPPVPRGPHTDSWWQTVPLKGAVALYGWTWLTILLMMTGYWRGEWGVISLTSVIATMFIVQLVGWWAGALLRYRKVLILRWNDGQPVLHTEWWYKAALPIGTPGVSWIEDSGPVPIRVAILVEGAPAGDGKGSGGALLRPFDPWRAKWSEVSSHEFARALEQSSAERLFSSRVRRRAEVVKLAALGLIVGAGFLLIFLLSGSSQGAPPA